MSISWIAPAALAGIALIVLPIAVHLLVRQLARQVPFPSLRFLQETQLAALRRRTIQDAWLLVCRAAIIVAAVIALAGPVLRSDARMAALSARTSRAIVVIDSVDQPVLDSVRGGAFRSEVFTRESVRDALTDAVRWLNAQPPSSREIVVAGSLRRGSITDADVRMVAGDIGIRFHPVSVDVPSESSFSTLNRRNGALVRVDYTVTLSVDETRVAERSQSPQPADLVTIAARQEDTVLANAALAAALDEGVPWADFVTPVIVVWEGGAPPARSNARVISMAVPSRPASAARSVYDALVRGTPRPRLQEPIAIAPQQLSEWTRAPGAVSTTAPLTDEGDRRWMWLVVLILLGVEAWLRRPVVAAMEQQEDARVA